MPESISSPSNPRIKNIVKLQSGSRERREQNLFVIEGFREIERALLSGIELSEIYICPELDKESRGEALQKKSPKAIIFLVSKPAFEKVAYREGSDGLIALAIPSPMKLNDVKLSHSPLVLVLEAVEKPGNLGAMMRTADAAAIDAVIVCDPATDIYNPNAIRSAVGCMFTTQLVTCSTNEVLKWLKEKGIRIFAAALTSEAKVYYSLDFKTPTAIVMGTESTGLSRKWLDESDVQVIIPMKGIADSLNVSVSAAVLLFEAVRQRDSAL